MSHGQTVVTRVGKRAAGHMLDRCTWDQMSADDRWCYSWPNFAARWVGDHLLSDTSAAMPTYCSSGPTVELRINDQVVAAQLRPLR